MLFVPNLFDSYIRGREYAIDRNWNDRNQFNNVVQGELSNDRAALGNLFAQTTFGDQVARANAAGRVAQNNAAGSDMDLELRNAGFGGQLGLTQAQSATQEAQAAAVFDNLRDYARLINRQTESDLGLLGTRIDTQNRYGPPLIQNTARNNVQQSELNSDLIQGQTRILPAQLDAQERIAQGTGMAAPTGDNLLSQLGTFGAPQQPVPTQGQNTATTPTSYDQIMRLAPGQAMPNPLGMGLQYVAKDNNGYLYAYNIGADGLPADVVWVTGPQATGSTAVYSGGN